MVRFLTTTITQLAFALSLVIVASHVAETSKA